MENHGPFLRKWKRYVLGAKYQNYILRVISFNYKIVFFVLFIPPYHKSSQPFAGQPGEKKVTVRYSYIFSSQPSQIQAFP